MSYRELTPKTPGPVASADSIIAECKAELVKVAGLREELREADKHIKAAAVATPCDKLAYGQPEPERWLLSRPLL